MKNYIKNEFSETIKKGFNVSLINEFFYTIKKGTGQGQAIMVVNPGRLKLVLSGIKIFKFLNLLVIIISLHNCLLSTQLSFFLFLGILLQLLNKNRKLKLIIVLYFERDRS